MTAHTIHICPICHTLADYSDDFGWGGCHHEPYGEVEPVKAAGHIEDGRLVFDVPDTADWKTGTGAAILIEKERKAQERAAWLALTCDERVAALKERERIAWEKFGRPMISSAFTAHMISMFNVFSPEISRPCPRCHDVGCENAVREKNPNYQPPFDFSGGYTIKTEGGSTDAS